MANQLLVNGGVSNPKLTLEQSIGRYFSNPKLSDVCFLVGEEQPEKIYAHRFLLAIESEVFESMFHGELKETRYEIDVPDLSPVGFRNMMKYFYTKKVEFGASEMYETYMAANKYLATDLIEDLSDYITKICLDLSNVCIIYDQLLKLEISDSLISDVKFRIAARFSKACESSSFTEIGKGTLLAILNFNVLNTSELELVKACIKWTDCEVARQKLEPNQANKRMVFEPIKHLIRFDDLSVTDLSSIFGLDCYLTMEEIARIFLHISHKSNPLPIDYQSPRIPTKVRVARCILNDSISSSCSIRRNLEISVNFTKKICVSSIKIFANNSYFTGLELRICEDEKELPELSDFKIDFNCWLIDFSQSAYILEPNTNYMLKFTFVNDNYNGRYRGQSYVNVSRDMTLKSEEGEVVFNISSSSGYHCIESIDYLSI